MWQAAKKVGARSVAALGYLSQGSVIVSGVAGERPDKASVRLRQSL